MTLTEPTASGTAPTAPLLTRALTLYFVSAFGAMTSFYLLLAVVPLYATAAGAGRVGAGLTTTTLMLATVAAELVTPALLARLGYRAVLAAGLVLLGAPALALIRPAGLATILAVCLVRGIGLAILVVAGASLVASLVPSARRSEAFGALGIVAGVPAVLALPAGVWLAERVGYAPVFVAAALVSLACVAVIPALPGRTGSTGSPVGVLEGLRTAGLLRPALVFLLTAMGTGIVVTFLPLATRGSGRLAAVALLSNTLAAMAARWIAGRFGSRHGQPSLLVVGTVLGAIGMATLAFIDRPAAVATGAVLLGIGFGVAQNASLTLMFDRVTAAGYDMASAMYNLAYDAGMGLGAGGFGAVVVHLGYPGAFALTGAFMLLALTPAWRSRSWLG
ncbi:MAG TPA: MFS transporter [Gemmatimonadales bacterium]|nr:MFS transporter [Gemmatimonadales bacterium]